jgi:quercetin dioxygenase-like cupin family protein
MYIVSIEAVEFREFSERGARGVKRKTLVDASVGSKRFYLRYYRVEPGGQTPLDIHDYEHIVVITKGRGSVLTMVSGAPTIKSVRQGDVIFIASREPHQFINTGSSELEFLCFRGADVLYRDEVRKIIEEVKT